MNRSAGKRNKRELFYVVTRDGRRAWPKDYWTLGEAEAHAESLIAALKCYKDKSANRVVIVETADPDSIK